jgi:predicted DNA-binding antitoxin AbrB/MazE fold protein
MSKQIEVIYTHGIFRPFEPIELDLKEGQRLILTFCRR